MSDTRWLDADEQHTWRSFLTANRLFFDAIERQLQQDSGLPHAYYEILVRLSEAKDGRLRMSELAVATQGSRSRLSHAVNRLEQAGWVRREGIESDRRGQVAIITEVGLEKLVESAPGHVEEVRRLVFDALDPRQVGHLRAVAEQILGRVDPGSSCPS